MVGVLLQEGFDVGPVGLGGNRHLVDALCHGRAIRFLSHGWPHPAKAGGMPQPRERPSGDHAKLPQGRRADYR